MEVCNFQGQYREGAEWLRAGQSPFDGVGAGANLVTIVQMNTITLQQYEMKILIGCPKSHALTFRTKRIDESLFICVLEAAECIELCAASARRAVMTPMFSQPQRGRQYHRSPFSEDEPSPLGLQSGW